MMLICASEWRRYGSAFLRLGALLFRARDMRRNAPLYSERNGLRRMVAVNAGRYRLSAEWAPIDEAMRELVKP